nr:putative Ig domain-containing protein [Candidatus Kapabacteria bacterium]
MNVHTLSNRNNSLERFRHLKDYHTKHGAAFAAMVYMLVIFSLPMMSFAQVGTVSTFSGTGIPMANGYMVDGGALTTAKYRNARSITLTPSGNLYVLDAYAVRQVNPVSGDVITLAGADEAGYVDGPGVVARFESPSNISSDNSGNLYVTDANRIRMITPSGDVSTFAGNGISGHVNGFRTLAQFSSPNSMAFDSFGNMYVSDNHRVRKIAPDGMVSTLFNNLYNTDIIQNAGALAVDQNNNLYIGGVGIWKVTPSGDFSFLFQSWNVSYIDGFPGGSLVMPLGMSVDPQGNLLLAQGFIITKLTPLGAYRIAGADYSYGYIDGHGSVAKFYNASGVVQNAAGELFVADNTNQRVRKITPGPAAQPPTWVNQTPSLNGTIGAPYSYTFLANGIPTPTYSLISGTLPSGLSFNPSTGVLSGTPTLAGSFGPIVIGASNSAGAITSTPFIIVIPSVNQSPTWVNQSPALTANVGAAYSYTFLANGIPTPTYSLVSGTIPAGLSFNPSTGEFSGTPTTAGSYGPIVIGASNSEGSITSIPFTIVVSSVNQAPTWVNQTPSLIANVGTAYSYIFLANGIPNPTYSLVSGTLPPGLSFNPSTGELSGTPTTAGSYGPIVIDASNSEGSITSTPFTIVVPTVSCTYPVTTFAGGGASAVVDGTGTSAQFGRIYGMGADVAGNIYLTDGAAGTGQAKIRKITPAGVVSTIYTNPTPSQLLSPGLGTDASGNVYFAEGKIIKKLSPAGTATTIADVTGVSGNVQDVAVDDAGFVYYTDGSNINKISPSGTNTLITTIAAGIYELVVYSDGTMYVSSSNTAASPGNRVYKITPSGVVTLLASDGLSNPSGYSGNTGIVLDASGNLYVSDYHTSTIRYVNTATGVMTTIAGAWYTFDDVDGNGLNARIALPWGLGLNASGELYIANNYTRVRKLNTCGVGGYFPNPNANIVAPTWVNQSPALTGSVGVAYSYTFLANSFPTPT